MRIFLITICLCFIANASVNAEFLFDGDRQEILKKSGEITFEDLAVGETGLIHSGNLCSSRSGKLMILSKAELDLDPTPYSNLIKIKRMLGGVWDADVRPGKQGYSSDARLLTVEEAAYEIIIEVLKQPYCEVLIENYYDGMGIYAIPLNSFVGAIRLSELFPQLTNNPE